MVATRRAIFSGIPLSYLQKCAAGFMNEVGHFWLAKLGSFSLLESRVSRFSVYSTEMKDKKRSLLKRWHEKVRCHVAKYIRPILSKGELLVQWSATVFALQTGFKNFFSPTSL